MLALSSLSHARLNALAACAAISCPLQILVVDDPDGPASVLISTISRLLARDVSVTTLDDYGDALRALDCCAFDLIAVGLGANRPLQLTVLPYLHSMDPTRPIVAVGRDLPDPVQRAARIYGAREVLDLPDRAAGLKALLRHMTARYLAAV